MLRLGNLRSRFWNLFRKQRLDHDLNSELQTHLDFLTEENIRRGMNPKEAAQAARREFGGVEQAKERYPAISAACPSSKHSYRTRTTRCICFARVPASPPLPVLTLALGIGANACRFWIGGLGALASPAVPGAGATGPYLDD